MYEVYLVTNTVNGMRYVGVTSQGLKHRFEEHLWKMQKGSTTLFHNALREFGVDNFIIELIESNIEECNAGEREKYYIALYDTYYVDGHGYNMTIGGPGTIGYLFTDEVRAKLSQASSGRVFSEERNQRLREMMTGRDYKPEWRAALSAARQGRFTGADNPFYGKHHSDETKQLLREQHSGDRVLQFDTEGNLVNEFFNLKEAGTWVANNVSTSKANTCAGRIRVVCNNPNDKCTAYGYRWKLKGRSID